MAGLLLYLSSHSQNYTIANGVLPPVQESKHCHLYMATSSYYLMHSRILPVKHCTTSGCSDGLTLVQGPQAQCCYAPMHNLPVFISSKILLLAISSAKRHTLQRLTSQITLHAIRCMLLQYTLLSYILLNLTCYILTFI